MRSKIHRRPGLSLGPRNSHHQRPSSRNFRGAWLPWPFPLQWLVVSVGKDEVLRLLFVSFLEEYTCKKIILILYYSDGNENFEIKDCYEGFGE